MAALHCGWRPLAGGIVAEGVARAARGRRRRPDHGRARPGRPRLLLRGRRGGPRALRRLRRARGERNLDLAAVARAAARGARRRDVHDVGLCTICDERFFSHRRDQRRHRPPGGGRVPRLITGLDAGRIARQPRARARGDRRRRPRSGRGRDPRRGQVRPARGARHAARGRADAAGREPRAGARGQGDRCTRSSAGTSSASCSRARSSRSSRTSS